MLPLWVPKQIIQIQIFPFHTKLPPKLSNLDYAQTKVHTQFMDFGILILFSLKVDNIYLNMYTKKGQQSLASPPPFLNMPLTVGPYNETNPK